MRARRSFEEKSDAIATIEIAVALIMSAFYALAGSDFALALLIFGVGLVPGWLVFGIMRRRTGIPSLGWGRRLSSSVLTVVLLQLYVFVIIALWFSLLGPLLQHPPLAYPVIGFLVGVFLAAFIWLTITQPWWWPPRWPLDERDEETQGRLKTVKLAALIAGGASLSLFALAFGTFVLLEYVVGPLIRYFTG